MPTQVPTEEQVLEVRRIAALTSRGEALVLIASLNDAEWARALVLVAKWEAVADRFTVVKTSEIKSDPADKRVALRDEMRVLLGLPPYFEADTKGVSPGPISVAVKPVW